MAKRSRSKNTTETQMVRALDDLSEFEEYTRTIRKDIQRDLKAGMSAKDILNKYEAQTAAKMVSIALTETDPTKALAALKYVQDKASGRPTEKKEVKLDLEELPEEQLQAKLNSLLNESALADDSDVDNSDELH